MAHDTWARRRQGFKQKTLMIPQDMAKVVEKYAKQRNTTQRVVWDEVEPYRTGFPTSCPTRLILRGKTMAHYKKTPP